MKTKQYPFVAIAAVFSTLLLTACDKDKEPDNEEELITTLKVNASEIGSGAISSFVFRDPDGDGGAMPTKFDTIRLKPNTAYNITLEFLNESVTPTEDITDEILDEATDHQIYYLPSAVNVTATNLNLDAKGLPLGTSATWNAGAASQGVLKIVLKHKPGQKAAGDPVTKGDTDIDIDFVTRVQ
jgi:hypothetical protein